MQQNMAVCLVHSDRLLHYAIQAQMQPFNLQGVSSGNQRMLQDEGHMEAC